MYVNLYLPLTCSHSQSDWEPDDLPSLNTAKLDNDLEDIGKLSAVKPAKAH